MFGLHRVVLRYITPLIWTFSPKMKCSALHEFSLIEKDSACQLLKFIRRLDSPEMQADLFQHALEELYHADLFTKRAESLSDKPSNVAVVTRAGLGDPDDTGLLEFFSYVHAGEKRVNQDFTVYANVLKDRETVKVFHLATADEAHHEADSAALLDRFSGGSKWKARLAILRAELLLWHRSNINFSRKIGELLLNILLSAIYFIFGFFLSSTFRRRLHLSDQRQLEIFSKTAPLQLRSER